MLSDTLSRVRRQRVFHKVQVQLLQWAQARLRMCRCFEARDDVSAVVSEQNSVATFMRRWVKSGLARHVPKKGCRAENVTLRDGSAPRKEVSRNRFTRKRPTAHVAASRLLRSTPAPDDYSSSSSTRSSSSTSSSHSSPRVAPLSKRPRTHPHRGCPYSSG